MDQFLPLSFRQLLGWILSEYQHSKTIFNIPAQWFYIPDKPGLCRTNMFGQPLSTPFGPAAGPHTQLAQNIISAWLCGARFIELKTVQVMDELEIPRPCIDMTDEGYNVEWSQELKLEESAREYIHAWVVIHILKKLLKIDKRDSATIFNMSVGYTLEGISSHPMLKFLSQMKDASNTIDEIREDLRKYFPEFADIQISPQISDNVTVSTMHGCPPAEIQRIGEYLIREHNLHTIIKLNPTLLGKEDVGHILKDSLGFSYIEIPESVFDADLGWDQAVNLINALEKVAATHQRHFGIKLSNTLAMRNELGRLPGSEMYMSGRALYPVTVNLFARIQKTFTNRLHVSYSAGADAMNVSGLIEAGAMPVTVASDLLKPGGYGRLRQYIENLEAAMSRSGAENMAMFQSNATERLARLADEVLHNTRHQKAWFKNGLPKLDSSLMRFDCITAPCTQTCPAHQNPPAYIRRIASGQLESAFTSILSQNPLPGMTGYVCPHVCQEKCTRNVYDEPVAIRNLKRYVQNNVQESQLNHHQKGPKVAIIGAGPAGLSAAAFLTEYGISPTIFEASGKAGGVPGLAPEFRIPESVVQSDVNRILNLGVELRLNHPVEGNPEQFLTDGFEAVFYAPGFQKDIMLDIPGADVPSVLGVMEFLALTREGEQWSGLKKVVVIGGGNTAMDAARTARRMTGKPATVIYRRTRAEMPAWDEEIADTLEEGNTILELLTPVRINAEDGFPVSITCRRNELGAPGPDGRRKPIAIEGSDVDIQADLVIFAIGQKPGYDQSLLKSMAFGKNGEIIVDSETGQIGADLLFLGGDAVRGPASIIQAVSDARRATRAIAKELEMDSSTLVTPRKRVQVNWDSIYHSRSRLSAMEKPVRHASDSLTGFELVEKTFTSEQAVRESERCLQCDIICDRCVDVCPNRANIPITLTPAIIRIPEIVFDDNQPKLGSESIVSILQERQVIHLDDWCNACGNCSVFCTHDGEPFKDKPCFFLGKNAFEASVEDGWFATSASLHRKIEGRQYCVTRKKTDYYCAVDSLEIIIDQDYQIKSVTGGCSADGRVSLAPIVEMIIFYNAITDHPVAIKC